MKDSKRRQSLCSSDDSEAEELSYHDVLPVLSDHSLLLDDHHLEKVSKTNLHIKLAGHLVQITIIRGFSLKVLRKLLLVCQDII